MAPSPAPGHIELRADEAGAARQLMGLAVGLGPSGVLCLKHLVESLVLFASGRLLVLALERIGLDESMQRNIHFVSHWYETAVFVLFSVFCGAQLLVSRLREVREAWR